MVIKFTKKHMMGPPMPPRDFARWYVDDIMRSEFPHFVRDLGVTSCEEKTRTGLRYAVHFGITRPDLQGQFMTIMWALGPNFFETAEFYRVLTAANLDEDAKVDALYQVSDQAGGYARQRADDRYWFPWLIKDNILGLEEDPELFDDLAPDEGWDD